MKIPFSMKMVKQEIYGPPHLSLELKVEILGIGGGRDIAENSRPPYFTRFWNYNSRDEGAWYTR